MKRLWYAIIEKTGDADYSVGGFEKRPVLRQCREMNDLDEEANGTRDFVVIVLDADFNDDGEPTTEPAVVELLDEDGWTI